MSEETISMTGPVEVSGQPVNPSCGTCRYFVKDSNQFADEPTLGSCHRNAPTNTNAYCKWPGVNELLWCGEHEWDWHRINNKTGSFLKPQVSSDRLNP